MKNQKLMRGIMSLVLFSLSLGLFAQNLTLRGKITDNHNEPLIGVTVQLRGTTIGTITDLNGDFTLSDIPVNGVIEVSYVGMQQQSIPVNGRTFISVTLEEDSETLDELVVIGYGAVKKRDLTGAVTSMSSEDIAIAPTTNVMEALSGKIPGMDIIRTSGRVGQGVDVLLRGSRSIYGDNSPLFIIDGIPGSYNQVNPSDIESVDVLKDASSTAIYGSAGANGVVIITTKRGKEGKTSVSLDSYFGFSGQPEFFYGMIGGEWLQYQREAYKYKNGQYPADISTLLPDAGNLQAYNQGKWIDWVDEAAGNTATNHKTNISINGGNEKTRVYTSLSFDSDKGLLKNENQNRYLLRFNVDHEIFNWLKTGLSSNINYADRNNGVNNTFTRSLSAFPLGDAYDGNGNINHEYALNQYSPLGDFIPYQFENNNKNTYVNLNGNIEIIPLEGLSIKTVINGTLNNSRTGQFWGNQANANRPSYAGSPHASITNNYGKTATLTRTITVSALTESKTSGVIEVTNGSGAVLYTDNATSNGAGRTLAKGSSWKIYGVVKDAKGNIVAYNLGGKQYVKASDVAVSAATTEKGTFTVRYAANPKWAIAVYNSGLKVQKLISAGSRWQTFGTKTLSDGKSYFNLGGNQWVRTDYGTWSAK